MKLDVRELHHLVRMITAGQKIFKYEVIDGTGKTDNLSREFACEFAWIVDAGFVSVFVSFGVEFETNKYLGRGRKVLIRFFCSLCGDTRVDTLPLHRPKI